jgi:hypothetical protein
MLCVQHLQVSDTLWKKSVIEYFGGLDAISIPQSMKISGIDALNMHFSTHFGCKSMPGSQKFSSATVSSKSPFRKIMLVLFFGV